MVRHNNMIHNVHLKFDWADKVKTWYNQPGRKKRRRRLRARKAALNAPNPTHKLRPIVRGQTNKYNTKIKLGKGFTEKELKEAGIKGLSYARSLGIAVDLRRKDTSKETLDLNAGRIKEYISRMILYPRNEKKPDYIQEMRKNQIKNHKYLKLLLINSIHLKLKFKILLKVLLNYPKKKLDIALLLLLMKLKIKMFIKFKERKLKLPKDSIKD